MLIILKFLISNISSDPIQYSDTPIQKIMIQPVTRLDKPADAMHRIAKTQNKYLPKIPSSSLIRITDKFQPVPLKQLRKYRAEAYPIFYARALVNGSFRNNYPIRSFPSE